MTPAVTKGRGQHALKLWALCTRECVSEGLHQKLPYELHMSRSRPSLHRIHIAQRTTEAFAQARSPEYH